IGGLLLFSNRLLRLFPCPHTLGIPSALGGFDVDHLVVEINDNIRLTLFERLDLVGLQLDQRGGVLFVGLSPLGLLGIQIDLAADRSKLYLGATAALFCLFTHATLTLDALTYILAEALDLVIFLV